MHSVIVQFVYTWWTLWFWFWFWSSITMANNRNEKYDDYYLCGSERSFWQWLYEWTSRLTELSPCKENAADMSHKTSISDRAKRQPNDSSTATASGSSLATSALDRLRYNLSPVASYYKPLMKSFTRRDESQSKVSSICFLSTIT